MSEPAERTEITCERVEHDFSDLIADIVIRLVDEDNGKFVRFTNVDIDANKDMSFTLGFDAQTFLDLFKARLCAVLREKGFELTLP
jgi:hypothetical protein